jgi:hypothetical protein
LHAGHETVTEKLLNARCNVDLQEKNGCTPLHIAAVRGHAAVTERLLAARCNNLEQDLVLHFAAQNGNEAVTKKLIEARCNVDLQMSDGFTPLHIAARAGHAAVTKQLLAARCNVDLLTDDGITALQAAEGQGHAGIATLIRNKKLETPLLGRRVVINGLVAKPELNGRPGTAVSFDDAKGRYTVELDTSSSLMIKPCNLLPVCSVAAVYSNLFSHVKTLKRLNPVEGMRPSQSNVASTSRLIMALLRLPRCKLLSTMGTLEWSR